MDKPEIFNAFADIAYTTFTHPVLKGDGSVELDYDFSLGLPCTAALGEIIDEGFFFDGNDQAYGSYIDMDELIENVILSESEN